jgi:hypothetical protein
MDQKRAVVVFKFDRKGLECIYIHTYTSGRPIENSMGRPIIYMVPVHTFMGTRGSAVG